MSFADTPYAGEQRFLPGQVFVIPLLVRQVQRGPKLDRQQDDPPFDPNEGVTYTVYFGQDRVPTATVNAGMTRVAPGLYQALHRPALDDPPGQYLVEAVATHGPKVQRTFYRGSFVVVAE